MVTVLFYISILIFSTFFVYISDKGKGLLERKTFRLIAFTIVFIPSAIRYKVGKDFGSYERIYESIEYIKNIEPGFYYLNLILKSLDADPQWVFAITAFIFTTFLFKSLPKKGGWIVLFITLSLLYYLSFSGIRQATAIMISLYSVKYLLKGEYKYFILFNILATTFHVSSMVFMLAGLTSLVPIKKHLKYYLLPNIFIAF